MPARKKSETNTTRPRLNGFIAFPPVNLGLNMHRINAGTVIVIVKKKRRCQSLSDDCLGHGDGIGEWP
jgi:hypothetical protein